MAYVVFFFHRVSLSRSNSHAHYRQQGPPPGSPEPPPAAPPPEPAPSGPARPAWRVVHKRPERTGHGKKKAGAGASPAPPPAAIEAPKPDLPAWAQWRRELHSSLSSLEHWLIARAYAV